jgi:hypothetical protein
MFKLYFCSLNLFVCGVSNRHLMKVICLTLRVHLLKNREYPIPRLHFQADMLRGWRTDHQHISQRTFFFYIFHFFYVPLKRKSKLSLTHTGHFHACCGTCTCHPLKSEISFWPSIRQITNAWLRLWRQTALEWHPKYCVLWRTRVPQ